MMRVLMTIDGGSAGVPGGHRRQLERTAQHVRALGVDVDVASIDDASPRDYAIVHGFGVSRRLAERTVAAGTPLVVSPIYWSTAFELNYHWIEGPWRGAAKELRRRMATALRLLVGGRDAEARVAAFWRRHEGDAAALRFADALLPNAQAEGEDLTRECGVDPARVRVVPNAVEPDAFDATSDLFERTHGRRDFVLSVGRVEPRKNQLRLVQACRRLRRPLVLVDPVHPDHAAYRARVRAAMSGDMLCLERLSDEMLRSAYAACRVHALPSFFETTGLSSLEAAAAGARIVVNEQPHTREYFEEDAAYCDPSSVPSIAGAIARAWEAPSPQRLRQRIAERFTWRQTAEATVEAYREALERRGCVAEAAR